MTLPEKNDVWLTSAVVPAGWEPGRQALVASAAPGRGGSPGCDVEGPARP